MSSSDRTVRESLNAPDVEVSLSTRSSSTPLPPPEHYLSSLLRHRARIQLTDSRLFEGNFHCFDSSGNIILADAVQIKEDGKQVRYGQILAGGKHIKCIWGLKE
jgi:small nuclear ribonucleoprotein (snRNP)-like protein